MKRNGHDRQERYITFKLRDNLIGVNILDIREIVKQVSIFAVPQAPAAVKGLINLRGQIMTVLDIGQLMGFGSTRVEENSHVIVFKHRNAGFLVDRIGDLVVVDPSQTEPVPANMDEGIKAYMDLLIHIKSQIIMTVNTSKILAYNPLKLSHAGDL